MDYMKVSKKVMGKYFSSTVTIYIQSSPVFIMEFAIFALAFIVLVIQILQVDKMSKRCLRLKPHMIYNKVEKDYRRAGYYQKNKKPDTTTTVYERPLSTDSSKSQFGWVIHGNSPKGDKYIEDLANITPQQFVKMEKERKLREKDLDSETQSLATLCQMVVRREWSRETLKKKVAALKENVECKTLSFEGKYLGFKAGDMSESLINMLENLITNTSVDKPLPFKGDITTLAVDAADLSNMNEDSIAPNLENLKLNCVDEEKLNCVEDE